MMNKRGLLLLVFLIGILSVSFVSASFDFSPEGPKIYDFKGSTEWNSGSLTYKESSVVVNEKIDIDNLVNINKDDIKIKVDEKNKKLIHLDVNIPKVSSSFDIIVKGEYNGNPFTQTLKIKVSPEIYTATGSPTPNEDCPAGTVKAGDNPELKFIGADETKLKYKFIVPKGNKDDYVQGKIKFANPIDPKTGSPYYAYLIGNYEPIIGSRSKVKDDFTDTLTIKDKAYFYFSVHPIPQTIEFLVKTRGFDSNGKETNFNNDRNLIIDVKTKDPNECVPAPVSYDDLYKAIVRIAFDSPDFRTHCTGFVFKKDDKYFYILTAGHCLGEKHDVDAVIKSSKKVGWKFEDRKPYTNFAITHVGNDKIPDVKADYIYYTSDRLRDVGLLRVAKDEFINAYKKYGQIKTVPLAKEYYEYVKGKEEISIGYPGSGLLSNNGKGDNCAEYKCVLEYDTEFLSVNKGLGRYETIAPEGGRSGSGLFVKEKNSFTIIGILSQTESEDIITGQKKLEPQSFFTKTKAIYEFLRQVKKEKGIDLLSNFILIFTKMR